MRKKNEKFYDEYNLINQIKANLSQMRTNESENIIPRMQHISVGIQLNLILKTKHTKPKHMVSIHSFIRSFIHTLSTWPLVERS